MDGSEPRAWDSISSMRGVVVDNESIQKVHSFLFVFVRLRSHYYAKKTEYNSSLKHPYVYLDASTINVMIVSTGPDSCTYMRNGGC
jgi:hypothetical protein